MESSYEYFTGEFDQNQLDYMNGNTNFKLDEFLEFPKGTVDEVIMADAFFDGITAETSSLTVVDSSNSSVSGGDVPFNGNLSCRSFTDIQFSGNELCVPYDDLADIEWLSNLVEESFSSEDLHDLQLINPPTQNGKSLSTATTTATASSSATINHHNPSPIFSSDVSVPGKARSKRSRAAPCDWSSRLLLLSRPKPASSRKKEPTETQGRRCLHCASEKTPQWRTGPMGPKTLCNACGVRYKSGRLVPEYRPASSPTFVSTKHSNSHRKVLELQRQKDLLMQQQQQQLLSHASIFGISNCGDDHFHRPRLHQMPNFGPADYRFFIS